MTHRSEYSAGKTESSVAVNAEADTTAGGWAIVYELMLAVCPYIAREQRTIAVVRSKVRHACIEDLPHHPRSSKKSPKQGEDD